MQCCCGGILSSKSAIVKKLDLAFDYEECKACGRLANEVLSNYARTEIAATGIRARQLFAAYTDEAPLL
ncbi:hypothetical protein SB5439_04962 [Klebsiella variicola]|uniref:hypothetical protein n=1 Tax=Klebsiella variicola TaxID=244366 RepID=UPI00109CABDA|nr:hypothetical protein [Klebsiella variicola]VGQ11526.1 hypothetical protein SB5439_04962 [Klebsiella variicola]